MSEHPDAAPEDAGEGDASGTFVTDTPEGWRERCGNDDIASQLEACAALQEAKEGDRAERLAFILNLSASEEGILPPGLGSLHFSHGRYAGWTVVDLRQAIRDDLAADAVLDELAIAVNRAFVNGHDSGALAAWVSTPICGAGDEVEGPASARCAMLDGACTRGRYLPEGACCTLELEPPGARCGAGQVCTPDGRCALDEGLPEFERAVTAIEAQGYAEALYVANEPSRVCVIQGRRLDELGPVMSDCSTPGAVSLACPGEGGGVACEHEEGFAVVRGDDLTMAFAHDLDTEDRLLDVWRQVFTDRVCVGFGCAHLLGGDMPDYDIIGIPGLARQACRGAASGPIATCETVDRQTTDGEHIECTDARHGSFVGECGYAHCSAGLCLLDEDAALCPQDEDGLYCTAPRCEPFGTQPCGDYFCITPSVCVEQVAVGCAIDQSCWMPRESNPHNVCQVCAPDSTRTSWTRMGTSECDLV